MARAPALEPAPVAHDPGDEYATETRSWQGIPGIERTPDGTWWATWYSGGGGEGPENYVALVRSTDGRRTWSDPRIIVDPPGHVRAFDPCLWVDPHDRLWLFWAQEFCKWDGRAGVWAIRASDPSAPADWTAPRRLCDGIMMNKPTAVADDRWLYPATRWDLQPQVGRYRDARGLTDDEIDAQTAALDAGNVPTTVYASRDYGESLERCGAASVPTAVASADEHMIVARRDGTLWMLIRTTYGIGETFSSDGGRTWTPVRDSDLDHPSSRFFLRRLDSGALLLVKHADPADRTDLTAYCSRDDGRTWSDGLLLDDRADVSYPDGVQADDGTITIVYDRDRGGAGEILTATMRERDVRAGEPVTDAVTRRQVVAALS